MKHLLYTIAALAALVLAASCTREQEGAISGTNATVTFTVTAPGVATKGLSDGSQIGSLAVAVYDGASTPSYMEALSQAAVITGSAPTWNVSIPVVKNLAYSFVFFAKSSSDNGFYTFSPSTKELVVDYTKLAANSDAADAFYGRIDQTTITGDMALGVNLERPLAQINVGAGDLANAALSLDLSNMTTGLTLTGINNKMNLLDGTLSGAASVTYAPAARVSENTAFTTGFDRIAMAYVLANAKQNTDVTVTIAGGGQNFTVSVPNAPIQKNYRTNILGNFFTGNVNVTVNMTPGFANADNYGNDFVPEYANITALNTAFGQGKGIGYQVAVLAPDNTGANTITLPATNGDVRIFFRGDFSNADVTLAYASNATASQKPLNVYITAPNLNSLAGDLQATHVEIESGSLINTGELHTSNSTLVIQKLAKIINLIIHHGSLKVEGEVTTAEVKETAVGATTTITSTAKVETLTVKAGSVEVEAPAEPTEPNTAATPTVQNLVIDNSSNTVEEVVVSSDAVNQMDITPGDDPIDLAMSEISTLDDFTAAISSGASKITLGGNITSDNGFIITSDLELDLNGYTFTVNSGSNCNSRAFRVDAGTLTVYGGSIVAVGAGTTSSNGSGCYGAFRVEANGKLVAHDLTLSNARPWGLNVKVLGGEATLTNVTINSSYGGGIEVTEADLGTHSQAGTATLNNCTFTQTGYFDHCSVAVSVSGGAEVTVNGGSYISENHSLYVFTSGGVITVNDGTFTSTGSKAAIVAAIDTNTYPQYTGGLQLKGGEYTGSFSIDSPAYMVITGGSYSEWPGDYIPNGYKVYSQSSSAPFAPFYVFQEGNQPDGYNEMQSMTGTAEGGQGFQPGPPIP